MDYKFAEKHNAPLKNLFTNIFLWGGVFFFIGSNSLSGQGAWTPTNADPSFPRTLIKNQEIPDLLSYLSQPVPFGLFNNLWSGLQSYSPPPILDSNGKRRQAAFNAKNAAFFFLLNHKPDNGALVQLTSQEAGDLRDFSIELMEMMVTNVEAYPIFTEYLWRSNELINNVIAYDLLKGASVPDTMLLTSKNLLIEYAGKLYAQVEFDFLSLGFLSLHVDNHAVRSCGALGLAAVVLSDESSNVSQDQPWNWFQLALYNIDNVLWKSGGRQSEPGVMAGYSEGPHYLRFGFKHVLPFFHSLNNFVGDTTFAVTYHQSSRTIDHPWYDENYDRLFEWVLRIGMPDGRNPALEDCFIATAWEELAIWEKPGMSPVVDYSRWPQVQPNSLWSMLHHSSDDIVADYLCAMTPDQPDTFKLFQALPESGNLVYRSGWDSMSTYLHFTAKNGLTRAAAQGHNQADASSFILYANGQLMALDPGYLKWDRRDEVAEADNHNMVLIDGQGPANSITGAANGADAFIENNFDLRGMDYAEVRTRYLQTDIVRKVLMVRKNHFFLVDEVEGDASHDYTFQLHGYGLAGGDSVTGYMDLNAPEAQAVWRKNAANLQATTTADVGLDTIYMGTNYHELRYDSIQPHSTMYASVENQVDATFLTSMVPFTTDTPDVSRICNVSCGSMVVKEDGYTDVATLTGYVSGADVGWTDNLGTDADFLYFSTGPTGGISQYFFENGQVVSLNISQVCSTSVPMDLAVEVLDSATYQVYASKAGTVVLNNLNFEPLSVNGIPVQSWNFDISSYGLEIILAGPGYFTIHEGVVVSSAILEEPSAMKIGPNPASGWLKVQVEREEGFLHLLDIQGREMKRIAVDGKEMGLSLQGLAKGVYFVIWEVKGEIRAKEKLVVR